MSGKRRIAVTGGRKFDDYYLVQSALNRLLRKGPFVIVHGGCSGADDLASKWLEESPESGCEVEIHPADWSSHGKAAGPIRNRLMARSCLAGCVAFPGGRGTANMVKECEAAGVKVWKVGGV